MPGRKHSFFKDVRDSLHYLIQSLCKAWSPISGHESKTLLLVPVLILRFLDVHTMSYIVHCMTKLWSPLVAVAVLRRRQSCCFVGCSNGLSPKSDLSPHMTRPRNVTPQNKLFTQLSNLVVVVKWVVSKWGNSVHLTVCARCSHHQWGFIHFGTLCQIHKKTFNQQQCSTQMTKHDSWTHLIPKTYFVLWGRGWG